MKKTKLLIAALFIVSSLISASVYAQDNSVKGKKFLNAGVGLGTFGLSGTGGLPITASFEQGVTDEISAGVFGGMVRTNFSSFYKYRYYIIGARGSYHFNELLKVANPKLDVYGGASLFYRGYSLKYEYHDDENNKVKTSGGTIGLALYAAARYLFTEKVGGYAELGYGISPLQLGVSLKF